MCELKAFALAPLGLVLCVLWAVGPADALTLEKHISGPNTVLTVDSLGGTLAIGTDRGLFVLRGGTLLQFTEEHGLPTDRIDNVVLADPDMMFAGPFEVAGDSRFIRATICSNQLVVTDITGNQALSAIHGMLAYGREGALWIGDSVGLRRFAGDRWTTYEWPESIPDFISSGLLCAAEQDVVWGLVYTISLPSNSDPRSHYGSGGLFRFDNGSWTVFSSPDNVSGLGLDSGLKAWCISCDPPTLWRFDARGWEIISEDSVLCPLDEHYPSRLEFDEAGALWAFGNSRLLKWADGLGVQMTEACGIQFQNRLDHFFSSLSCMGLTTVLFGTEGYGLIMYDGQTFSRHHVDGLSGDHIACIIQDATGAISVRDMTTLELSTYRDGSWERLFVPWMSPGGATITGLMDLDGALWFPAQGGAGRLTSSEVTLYGPDNSSLRTDALDVALDSRGSIWFCQPDYEEDIVVAELRNGCWEAYSNREFFDSDFVFGLDVGPGDVLWFRQPGGFTTFDGHGWGHLSHGSDLPAMTHISANASFDLDGNVILWGPDGAYRGQPGSDWEQIYDGPVASLKLDCQGGIWLGTSWEGLACGDSIEWRCITSENGLSDDHITTTMIDHNGDKWVGTKHGLNRIEDGGPAQQKLELSVEEDAGGYMTVNGTFTNAGAVIPVLSWLACEHDGSLYYYPTWGPTPEGTKRVLGAYSVETEELLRLDTSTLPSGDYTFYGGISLLGGIDLLIGARDNKIAIATYQND